MRHNVTHAFWFFIYVLGDGGLAGSTQLGLGG
jgi:hypothetical protein